MAFCLALLWVPASGHCRIEALTGAALFACAGDLPQDDHHAAPAADHCGGDSCVTVEDGHYRCDVQPVTFTPPVGSFFLFSLQVQPPAPVDLALAGNRFAPGQPPPELSVSWQFSSRVALPPRAPSLAS